MTVMSEGLPLNSKYIQMGREEGGFQALLTQPATSCKCLPVIHLQPCDRKKSLGARCFGL